MANLDRSARNRPATDSRQKGQPRPVSEQGKTRGIRKVKFQDEETDRGTPTREKKLAPGSLETRRGRLGSSDPESDVFLEEEEMEDDDFLPIPLETDREDRSRRSALFDDLDDGDLDETDDPESEEDFDDRIDEDEDEDGLERRARY